MRTPNCNCIICNKPLYRRPSELARVKFVCCVGCRSVAYKKYPNKDMLVNLEKGRGIKGVNHLNGIPKSPESNIKRSISHKKFWSEHPDKALERGKKIQGSKHYKWNGGISRLNTAVRNLNENRNWQNAIKARDKKCVVCGSIDNLESHHIIPLKMLLIKYNIHTAEEARNCAELWDLSNGITLCQKCHYKVHGRKYED